jgi:hypothetical protein
VPLISKKITKIKIKIHYSYLKTGGNWLSGVQPQTWKPKPWKIKGLKDSQYFDLCSPSYARAQWMIGLFKKSTLNWEVTHPLDYRGCGGPGG